MNTSEERLDYLERLASANLVDIIEELIPGGQHFGNIYLVQTCVEAGEPSCAICVDLKTSRWFSFECEEMLDGVVVLLEYMRGLSHDEAADILTGIILKRLSACASN